MTETKTKKVSTVQISAKELEVHHIDVTYQEQDTGPRFGCRHVQSILLCLGIIIGIATRTNLSVAIVAMTDNSTSPNPDIPVYDWTNTSIILSSFFWGYIILQIVAGYLGKTYGPKYFLFVAISISCCVTALIPLMAQHFGSVGVIGCRMAQGFSQSFLYPSSNVLVGRWVPHQERSTLCNFIFSGAFIGTIFGSLVTGYISASWWGWPGSFYVLAGVGFGWCILWLFFGQNSPASHPKITSEEKNYIQMSLKQEDDINLPVPWKQIATCIPFYAIMVGYIGNTWGYTILMTETPTYLSKVMNFDLKSNALLSTIPTAVSLICSLIMGPMSDWVISRNVLSLLNARRTFHLIGSYGQAACLIYLSCLNSSQSYLSIVVLALGSSLVSLVMVGVNINHLDLSSRFSGIVFGVVNAVAQCTSIIGPLSANWILTDPTDTSQWKLVFLIAAGFFIVGGTVFFFFSSTTRQSWDGPETSELQERRKKVSVISFMSI